MILLTLNFIFMAKCLLEYLLLIYINIINILKYYSAVNFNYL